MYEHIANKSHQLKVRDIEQIPVIIADENSVYKDKKSNRCKNYFWRRKGKNKKPYLKIITKIGKHKRELIINLYTVRRKGAGHFLLFLYNKNTKGGKRGVDHGALEKSGYHAILGSSLDW